MEPSLRRVMCAPPLSAARPQRACARVIRLIKRLKWLLTLSALTVEERSEVTHQAPALALLRRELFLRRLRHLRRNLLQRPLRVGCGAARVRRLTP
jgi:hypothetical protein